jgi:dihydrofolate reductase
MSRLVVINHLTLDGVMQAPGRPGEDLRDGFEHGGWAQPRNDAVMADTMSRRFPAGAELLLGRRTYQGMADFWPKQQNNPMSTMLDNMHKYVASKTLTEPLPWQNSTLLKGDAVAAVTALLDQGKNLVVFGSGELLQPLMQQHLIDEYVLLIHPLVLGSGRHLFVDGAESMSLQLVDSTATTKGVVIGVYQDPKATKRGAAPSHAQ